MSMSRCYYGVVVNSDNCRGIISAPGENFIEPILKTF